MKYLLIPIIILLTACCTKKECDYDQVPSITFLVSTDSITGFNNTQIKNLVIKIVDQSFITIDSFRYWNDDADFRYQYKPIIYLDDYLINSRTGKNLLAFNYLFLIPGRIKTDTLSEISYSFQTEKINCNSCFPFGDGSATQTTIASFNANFNSKQLNNIIDTLFITR